MRNSAIGVLRSSWAVFQLTYICISMQDIAEVIVMNKLVLEGDKCGCRPIFSVY